MFMSRNPLEQSYKHVNEMRSKAPLLRVTDKFFREKLLWLASEEVAELAEALSGNASPEEVLDELNDVWVFLSAWILSVGYDFPWTEVDPDRVNGFGRHPDALPRLQETILDVSDNPEAILAAAERLYSVLRYLPHPDEAMSTFVDTIEKVLANRPPELYQVTCSYLGRQLTPEEAQLKYAHLEIVMRMLRRARGRTLNPQDWQLYKPLAEYWLESDLARETIGAHLLGNFSDEELEYANTQIQSSEVTS